MNAAGIDKDEMFRYNAAGMALKKTVPRKTSAGKVKRAIAAEHKPATTDITARQQAEQALRDSEARLRAILDTAVNGIITMDEQGIIESFNHAAERLFGYPAREALGQNVSLLMPSPHRDQHDRYLANYRNTGVRKVIGLVSEQSGRRKDGTMFPMELSLSEVRLAERRLFTGIARDITQRKQMEAALREESDFISAVLQTAGALVVVLDESGQVVRFNRTCEQVSGYAAEEIVGKPFWGLLPPEEVAAVQSVFEQLRAGRLPSHFENCWLTKAGQRRLISWSNTVLTKPDGTVKHIIGTGLDITERKRDELRRHLHYETVRLLAASGSLAEAVPKLLQAVAAAFSWHIGEFWEVDTGSKTMRVKHVWHAPGTKLAAFVKHGLKHSVPMFDGLLGRVLASRKPDWIPEITQQTNFERNYLAARAGLHSALAFPILLKNRALGVIVFLTHRATEPDEDLLEMFATLGSQIGQFMESKKAGEALREANEFGKQVIGGAEAGIIVYDREGRYVVWNPFMERLSGYRADEVLGRRTLELFPFLRKQHFEEMFARALAGEIFESPEAQFDVPEKGKRGWKVERFSPLRDAREQIVGVIVAVRDITERHRLESELREISDREQRRIGHDLHDGLGQQLTGLEMKCFLLLEDMSADDFAARRGQLQEQVQQISQALRECVTLTRSIARGLAPVNVKADGLMGALEQLARNTHVPGRMECRFVCPAPVMLDNPRTAGHLFRIAQEAVNNALKHARTRRIHLNLAHDQGALRLQIKDDGRGLSKSRGSKSGMGLEVMRHRAYAIGASLKIDSKPGQGVSVTCTFPLENHEH